MVFFLCVGFYVVYVELDELFVGCVEVFVV